MKQYKVGLVGIGAVGTEMVKVLRQRNFPASEIRILATRERDEEIAGETFHVLEAKPDALSTRRPAASNEIIYGEDPATLNSLVRMEILRHGWLDRGHASSGRVGFAIAPSTPRV